MRPDSTVAAGGRLVLYYHDPMHPSYRSDKPGTAPDCGMQLEPVYADGPATDGREPSSIPPGALNVSPGNQRLIGVSLGFAAKSPIDAKLRILGRVVADETRVVRVSAADGWVQVVTPLSTGEVVRKGQLLAIFYSKEYVAPQLSFLYSQSSLERTAKEKADFAAASLQAASAEKELLALGMSETQIKEVARTRKAATDLELRAPADGFILARNIYPGMKFDRSAELYRIADLSRIWILADVFGAEAQSIQPGMSAEVTLPGQTRKFHARVSRVLPQFDRDTRTLKVRLEAVNPGFFLRPDMFVDVEVPLHLPSVLTIPAEALLDSGLQKRVYIARDMGNLEAREVGVGRRFGDRVEIVSGLTEGERVVVSGAFLIDAESRLRAIPSNEKAASIRDLVCGMDLDPKSPSAVSLEHDGKVYYFCSTRCRDAFQRDQRQRQPGPAS